MNPNGHGHLNLSVTLVLTRPTRKRGVAKVFTHASLARRPGPPYLYPCILFLFTLLNSVPAFAQRQAQLPWWDRAPERTIGPYWIKSDLAAEDVNAIGQHLNVMWREYDRALAGVPVRVQEKLRVLIFKNRDEAVLTLRTRYAVAGANEGGYFLSPADEVLVLWTEDHSPPEVERLIQREAFRQFAFNRFGEDLPLWLGEGLAELFGESILIGDALIFGQSTPRMCEQLKDAIANDKHIPLATLLAMPSDEWNSTAKDSSVLPYRQARSMALFVMQNRDAFARYARHLNNGLPEKHAFARSFGPDIAAFEVQWKHFALTMKPGALVTARERIEFLAEGAAELARQNMQPQSLDALKTMLRQIGFAYTIRTHREELEISAADESPFEIPQDDLCRLQPVFALGKARPSANPMPPPISTQNLRPTGVQVKWTWDKESKKFVRQILFR